MTDKERIIKIHQELNKIHGGYSPANTQFLESVFNSFRTFVNQRIQISIWYYGYDTELSELEGDVSILSDYRSSDRERKKSYSIVIAYLRDTINEVYKRCLDDVK
jgi:hypothetical protein